MFVFFGLVAVAGTSWVQVLAFHPDSLTAGVALGAASTAILVVNNLRDMETDARAGKRTLAVRLGRRWTQGQYVLLLGLTAAVPPAGMALHGWSPWVLLSLCALPAAAGPIGLVLTCREPASLNRGLAGTGSLPGPLRGPARPRVRARMRRAGSGGRVRVGNTVAEGAWP